MFESNTYDAIMERIMDKMPATVATDEGSFLYTAAGPVGIEHEQIYAAMDVALTASFITTAPMEYLVLAGKTWGLTPHEATPAVWSVVVTPSIMSTRIGTRFNCGTMNLVTTGRVEAGIWELTCETAGSIGNTLSGDLVPISYIYGMEKAELYELLVAGSDAETEEEFRKRLLFHIQKPAATGNIYNYIEWATSVTGVGAAKVFPTWNGPGTVKVVITNSEKRAAEPALVNAVAAYIEEERPIGASVTVTSGTELPINISANIRLKSGYVLSTVQANFKDAVAAYLEENAFVMDYLPISRIGSILLDIDGIGDYDDLRVNDGTTNIDLSAEQIAIIGTVVLEVIV